MSWEELSHSRIYYDATRGVPGTTWPIGTPGVPSNTIADVITMLAARNLKAIDVHGAVTIAVDVTHKDFFGNYHESVADIVTLGAGNDVSDSHFERLIISGAQGGTGLATYKECLLLNMTGFRGLAENCAIFGTLAVATGNADFADFDHCTSVHGVITVTIAAPDRVSFKEFSGGMILTAQTAGAVLVRGISGYLEVDAMDGAGATLDIYAHGADIKINANCAAGTINIYGDARVTVIAGATVTINDYTLQTGTKGLTDIHDDLVTADGKVTYTEDSVSGTTGNAYATVADLDMRGVKNGRIAIKNTDGANSLTWKLQARHANYTAGVDEDEYVDGEIEHVLAAGTKYSIPRETAFSREKVLLKSTVVDTPAAYTVEYLQNR